VISERESHGTIAGSMDTSAAVVYAGDYLNKLAGEQVERECKRRLSEGCTELIVNFSQTEIVNSIGVSILLGVIDSASNTGATIIFSDIKPETVELFEMLGLTKHVVIKN
jgi:anti-anti-sigma regulatory factor